MRSTSRIGSWALAIAALCSAPADADFIGLYTFDDGTARDSSGQGNHGVVQGATATADGRFGGGFDFGNGASILIPINVTPAAMPQMTWGAWFRPTGRLGNPGAFGQSMTILSSDNGGFDRTLTIDNRSGVTSGSALAVGAFQGSGVLSSGLVPTLDEWHFVAASYDQATRDITMYVGLQGQGLTTAFASTSAFDSSSFLTLLIGNNPGFLNSFFTGTIDEVFIANRVMSRDEIDAMFTRGNVLPIPEPASLVSLGIGLLTTLGLARRLRSGPGSDGTRRDGA